MSNLFPNYARDEIDIVNGNGLTVLDQFGKQYLDLTSGIGVSNLGHQHPAVMSAVNQQLTKVWHTSNLYFSQLQENIAAQLADGEDYLAFFCNSGAEANEAAIKIARKATGRKKIITFYDGFHGRTYGAMSATAQEKIQAGFGPMVPDFIYLPYNDISSLADAFDEDVAGVLLELVQGEGGVLPANQKFVTALANLAKENGSLLMIDEIQTGIGRTGSLYAFQQYQIEPDVFTLAKGLGNGIPVGAMLGKTKLKDAFGPGSHGTTFGGNKLALSVAEVVLNQINQPEFLAAVTAKGEKIKGNLAEILSLPIVQTIRGTGLMIGIQYTDQESLNQVLAELKAQGVLALKAGNNVLRLLPALIISEAEIKQATDAIITASKKVAAATVK